MIRKIGIVAAGLGAVISLLCLHSLVPDAHAVIQGSESVEITNIGEAALCVAPLGIGFVLAFIAALAGE